MKKKRRKTRAPTSLTTTEKVIKGREVRAELPEEVKVEEKGN